MGMVETLIAPFKKALLAVSARRSLARAGCKSGQLQRKGEHEGERRPGEDDEGAGHGGHPRELQRLPEGPREGRQRRRAGPPLHQERGRGPEVGVEDVAAEGRSPGEPHPQGQGAEAAAAGRVPAGRSDEEKRLRGAQQQLQGRALAKAARLQRVHGEEEAGDRQLREQADPEQNAGRQLEAAGLCCSVARKSRQADERQRRNLGAPRQQRWQEVGCSREC
mmetsp:Transcript_4014/g.11757  ORF Transcript_4014/g.11757 Transcript_4014/m.11757 type:complete len:221 (-) Transcript_4014:1006-1668(-)